ncbi:PREDICTED: diacylglycerol O-acyltransferase 1, partial [Pseudopodoces humilis]|uniref:diacylglycerol O-acyltransferase 1 n=1 Tax=Pseudopodoces humilis TaxID=181119 RepID=UPI0006B7EC97
MGERGGSAGAAAPGGDTGGTPSSAGGNGGTRRRRGAPPKPEPASAHGDSSDDPAGDFRCHKVQESLLSSASGYSNYRGVLNWCVVMLVRYPGGPNPGGLAVPQGPLQLARPLPRHR